jgi:hypothetical protein
VHKATLTRSKARDTRATNNFRLTITSNYYYEHTEAQINAFLDKIAAAMLATVKAGLAVKEGVLPGPIKLHSKA